jgi:hypothetical protein
MIRQIGCCFLFIRVEFHAYDITADIETCSNTSYGDRRLTIKLICRGRCKGLMSPEINTAATIRCSVWVGCLPPQPLCLNSSSIPMSRRVADEVSVLRR